MFIIFQENTVSVFIPQISISPIYFYTNFFFMYSQLYVFSKQAKQQLLVCFTRKG